MGWRSMQDELLARRASEERGAKFTVAMMMKTKSLTYLHAYLPSSTYLRGAVINTLSDC